MSDWIVAAVPLFKALHIAGLAVWCAGLLALPLMLTRHDPEGSAADYRLIRRASHLTYTMCVTPVAVIAVIAGTWLIFLREVFTVWLYAKLAFVVLLVIAHAWIGHIIVKVGEEPETHAPPPPYLPIATVLFAVIAILFLVLAKPALDWFTFPEWLLEPRGGQLPFEVPSR
jgi:uncharacterized membrane protein